MSIKDKKPNFTKAEVDELKYALKKGGVFLKVYQKDYRLAEILKADDNGGWEVMLPLSVALTIKLRKFYSDPAPAGYHMFGLKCFIDKYC